MSSRTNGSSLPPRQVFHSPETPLTIPKDAMGPAPHPCVRPLLVVRHPRGMGAEPREQVLELRADRLHVAERDRRSDEPDDLLVERRQLQHLLNIVPQSQRVLEVGCRVPRQNARGHQLIQRRHGIAVEQLGPRRRLAQLQILGDEFDVDQAAAAMLHIPEAGIAMGFGTVVFASLLAFCGYVIDLLVQSELNGRETAFNVSRDDVPAPPKRYI